MIFAILEKIFAFFFPFYCLGCGSVDETICPRCLTEIPLLSINNQELGYLSRLTVVCRYEKHGIIASALHNWKYNYQKEFSNPLKSLFKNQIERLLKDDPSFKLRLESGLITVSFVPMNEDKLKKREFNQAEELANVFRELIPDVVVKKIMEKIISTPAQMSLTAEERFRNVQNSYKLSTNVQYTDEVLIVDDVLTTGATLQELARILKEAGVKRVEAMVLARQTD